jgi:flagellar motor switch protein FliN/FliY
MSSSQNSLSSSEAATSADPLDWVMDVPCPVDFVLGTATVTVSDCAQFAIDSILRLKQTAGSDLEVRVGGVSFATGQVVIVDENVGLRLSRILPPGHRDAS